MPYTTDAKAGMTVAPHGLAAETGLSVLRDGGNAAEAAIAMAAALAVLYPHMTGLGGDSFWLLAGAGGPVTAVDASGRSGAGVDPAAYRSAFSQMPHRGPWAANTVAGTVSGWQAAFEHSRRHWRGRLSRARLLADAVHFARGGCPVSASQARSAQSKRDELMAQPGFKGAYGDANAGATQYQPALASTLERLAAAGFDDFYRGGLAAALAAKLTELGSPLRIEDLRDHRATVGAPLQLHLSGRLPPGTVYTTAPPSQGLATLLILGLFDRAGSKLAEADAAWVHFLVEATKSAFRTRDELICDPAYMDPIDLHTLLSPDSLDRRVGHIDRSRASPWPAAAAGGDTTWFGVIDGNGRAVSCIQSIYHEFGSGVVLNDTGICWQNRGASFNLDPRHRHALAAKRKPLHTLCPSLARLRDGRTLVFGTMGGDGQPQTQAAILTRHLAFDMPLQAAVDAPRWVLGRTWGEAADTLKLEARFDPRLVGALAERGHAVELVAAYDEMMGHAGILARDRRGVLAGAADPRSDGAVAAF